MQANKRIAKYAKDKTMETVLSGMNSALQEQEAQYVESFGGPLAFPPVFIVGLQRSGSTLLSQILINHFQIGYISNFVARFWKAPYMGTVLFLSFLRNRKVAVPTESDLGYTEGFTGPHEFGYFWRGWFPEVAREGVPLADKSGLVKTINAIAETWAAPILFKNINTCSFVIEELSGLFPKALFLYIQRDDFFTAQSTYLSRIKLFNDAKAWLGLRPPEYEHLLQLDSPFQQIAGQIHYSKIHIEQSLDKLPSEKVLRVSYPGLCLRPEESASQIGAKLEGLGWNVAYRNKEFIPFEPQDKVRLSQEDAGKLKEALRKFQ